MLGDLRDLPVLTLGPVLVKRPEPRILGDFPDRSADRLGQVIADREAHPGLAAVVDQTVRCAGGIGAHQDLDCLDVLLEDLRQREVPTP